MLCICLSLRECLEAVIAEFVACQETDNIRDAIKMISDVVKEKVVFLRVPRYRFKDKTIPYIDRRTEYGHIPKREDVYVTFEKVFYFFQRKQGYGLTPLHPASFTQSFG